jgi:hypothetical protein
MKGNSRVTVPAAIRIEVSEPPNVVFERPHLNHIRALKKKTRTEAAASIRADLFVNRQSELLPCIQIPRAKTSKLLNCSEGFWGRG